MTLKSIEELENCLKDVCESYIFLSNVQEGERKAEAVMDEMNSLWRNFRLTFKARDYKMAYFYASLYIKLVTQSNIRYPPPDYNDAEGSNSWEFQENMTTLLKRGIFELTKIRMRTQFYFEVSHRSKYQMMLGASRDTQYDCLPGEEWYESTVLTDSENIMRCIVQGLQYGNLVSHRQQLKVSKKLRAKIVNLLLENTDLVIPLSGSMTLSQLIMQESVLNSYQEYINNIQNGAKIGDFEFYLIARFFGRPIFVYRAIPKKNQYRVERKYSTGDDPICLCFRYEKQTSKWFYTSLINVKKFENEQNRRRVAMLAKKNGDAKAKLRIRNINF